MGENEEASAGVDFRDALPSLVDDHADRHHVRDPETFYASTAGFCPRQTYLTKLGLKDTASLRGRFQASRLVQSFLTDALCEAYPNLDVEPSAEVNAGPVQFRGRPTCYDPVRDCVYHAKPRNGWYKFHPPVERHLEQLTVYMKGLDAARGQLVYISLSDLTDVRLWPPHEAETTYIEYEPERFAGLVTKATAIRNEIIRNGIALTTEAIPFEPCGCYFCESETLQLPSVSDAARAAVATNDAGTTSGEATDTAGGASGDQDAVQPPSMVPSATGETQVVTSDTRHVPRGLREHDIWTVWDGRSKVALAPWQSGTMYPCRWAQDGDLDPRREFETAQMVAELPVEQIHASWPFPDNDALPDRVAPAVLLPHDPPEPPITVIDFDDIRDPETGAVTEEVMTQVDQLGGYTEVSSSGQGLHVFVRAGLPEDVTTFSAGLEDRGRVEVYDHSRFVATTWAHAAGTPLDEVPVAGAALEALLDTYATPTHHAEARAEGD